MTRRKDQRTARSTRQERTHLSLGDTSLDDNVAAEKSKADATVDGDLALLQAALNEQALGGEPVSVVEDLGELSRDESVPKCANVAVEREALEVHVRLAKDRRRGALVASTRLDADEAVLDNVATSDTVLARESVDRKSVV